MELIQIRNTTIPASRTEIFTTTDKKSTGVNVHIVQGEHENAKDNESVGYIIIDDLDPKLKGEQKIEVTFNIDSNGILSVSAENKNTHKKISIVADENIETSKKVEHVKNDKSSDSKKHWWSKK